MKRLIGGGGTGTPGPAGTVSAAGSGTAAAPGIAFASDPNTGIYSPGADQLAVSTGGTGRLFIDATGNVGVGLSNPSYPLEVASSTNSTINITGGTSNSCRLFFSDTTLAIGFINYDHADDSINIGTAGSERLRITSAGLVGIGSTSPGTTLSVGSSATGGYNGGVYLNRGASTYNFYEASDGTNSVVFGLDNTISNVKIGTINSYPVGFYTGNSERARIDTSGRLLVGTSSSFLSYAGLQIKGTIDAGAHIGLANKFSAPTDGSNIGSIRFTNDVGGIGGLIGCEADGAWTAGSNYRSRLLFSTTADGAASPTERLRITSAGVLQIADAGNITVGTTTGTKIGTATTQKLGFYNATPVVQPTAVADATDAATVITQLNDLLAKLRTLGIIAT